MEGLSGVTDECDAYFNKPQGKCTMPGKKVATGKRRIGEATHHYMNLAVAMKHGIAAGLVYSRFEIWVERNSEEGKNIDEEGRAWTYDTYVVIASKMPYLSKKQVENAISALKDAGLIISKPSPNRWCRTNWYTFPDRWWSDVELDIPEQTPDEHGPGEMEGNISQDGIRNMNEKRGDRSPPQGRSSTPWGGDRQSPQGRSISPTGEIENPCGGDDIRSTYKTHLEDTPSFLASEGGSDEGRTSSSQKKLREVSSGRGEGTRSAVQGPVISNGPHCPESRIDEEASARPVASSGDPQAHKPPLRTDPPLKRAKCNDTPIPKIPQEPKVKRAEMVFITDTDHAQLVVTHGERVVQEAYLLVSDWKKSKAEVDPPALKRSTDLHHMTTWALDKAKTRIGAATSSGYPSRKRKGHCASDDVAQSEIEAAPCLELTVARFIVKANLGLDKALEMYRRGDKITLQEIKSIFPQYTGDGS